MHHGVHRYWVLPSVLFLLGFGAFYVLLARVSGVLGLWALAALPVLVYELVFLKRKEHLNRRRQDTPLREHLGIANGISLVRGFLLALLVGFLFAPEPEGWYRWFPAVLYAVAIVTDFFDGLVARKTDTTTLLGEALDMEFDGIGILVAVSLCVSYDVLPAPFLAVGFARYAFVAGLWMVRRTGRETRTLAFSARRKVLAGVQMTVLAVLLVPGIPAIVAVIAETLVAIPFLGGFVKDWVSAAGILDASSR
jgi:CDP-diacylglycerol--glycerol-3-phosphate 3-phosphatidyltransferase